MASELQEIWDRDPLKHSETDIKTVIEKLRSMRHALNAGAAPPRRKAGEKRGQPKVTDDPLTGVEGFEL